MTLSSRLRSVERTTWILLLCAFVGLAVRVGFVAEGVERACLSKGLAADCLLGDQIFYNAAANRLAEGYGFVEPFGRDDPFEPGDLPAADHPPLTVMVLAPVSWLAEHPPVSWIDDPNVESHARAHRLFLALVGSVTVFLIGVLGRRVADGRVAIAAAAMAAVHPGLWLNDGLVMSESITNLVVVGTLIVVYGHLRRPTLRSTVALGLMCGLAAMARAELLLFLVLLVVPCVWVARRPDRRAVIREVAAAGAAAMIVIGPWVIYNNVRFAEPTLISTNDGLALAGSNCDAVYFGGGVGLTSLSEDCNDTDDPTPGAPDDDQSQASRLWRSRALDYMGEHAGRVPAVVLARVGRVWGVFRPYDMVQYNEGEGRPQSLTRLATTVHFPMLALALVGAWLLRRDPRRRLWPLLMPCVVVTAGAALTYGQARFRAAAEPSIVVLAAVALIGALSWARTRWSAPTRPPSPAAVGQGSRQDDTA